MMILISLMILAYASTLSEGLIAPLIPPMSPESPYYKEILKFNNISSTTNNNNNNNKTLNNNNNNNNQEYYMKWFISKTNEKIGVYHDKKIGIYVMNMFMGYPLQKVYGMFDSGSSVVWLECNERAAKSKFIVFNQTRSLTYKTIGCEDKIRCNTTKEPDITGCDDDVINNGVCEFSVTYADGTHAMGVMSLDRIQFNMPRIETVIAFVFGCARENTDDYSVGVIGGSNREYSLPVQLNKNDPKFSYCMSDEFTKNNLINFGVDTKLIGKKVNMITNPNTRLYYIDVVSIKVNSETLDVPPSIFKMSLSGLEGFIIDSGATLTYLTSVAYDALRAKIENLLGPPKSYSHLLGLCYDHEEFGKIWPWNKRPTFGIELRYSKNNRFIYEFEEKLVWQSGFGRGSDNLECLMIAKTDANFSVFGALHLLNVNVGYDPNNSILYLEKMTCPSI